MPIPVAAQKWPHDKAYIYYVQCFAPPMYSFESILHSLLFFSSIATLFPNSQASYRYN